MAKGKATGTRVIKNTGNAMTNQANGIRCYNCKGEVHIARQCTQAKRAQNSEWFKDKMLLAQAQEVGVVMDKELAFLADNGEAAISGSPQARTVFMENLTPTGPIYDADTSPSYDSHIL
ncbi:cold shock domain protein 1 [Tanacetum coccineum]